MKEAGSIDLFNKIEMPLTEVLASMQYEGIYIDKQELLDFGKNCKKNRYFNTRNI